MAEASAQRSPFRLTTAAVSLVLTVFLAGCSPKSDENKAAGTNVTLTDAQRQHVRLFAVAPASFHKTVDTTGAVDFDNDQSTVVLAPFGGLVTQVLVTLGQHVDKGQALALVNSPDFAVAIDAYRKSVVTAANARRLADLDRDLFAHQGVSAREEQQAETDAANAEADRESARQSLVSLNVDAKTIADAQAGRVVHTGSAIRAPISGTVVDKPVAPGQLIQAGTTPCFTVADLSRVWVVARVFGGDLTNVSVGDSVKVTTGNGPQDIAGRVDNISAIVDPDTRAVNVRVVVDNPGDLLKKQQYVQVEIQSKATSTGILAPVSAVLRDDENLPFVYVRQPDGTFARRHVTPGVRTGDRVAIDQGLKSGERIVADGGLFLQFMQSQ